MNPERQPMMRSNVDVTLPTARIEPAAESGAQELMARWDRIQASFVDDPARALLEAEQLANQLTAAARDYLEHERAEIVRRAHAQGASTEDLRQCMQRYRVLLDRLLALVG